jgi:hypothetical protein
MTQVLERLQPTAPKVCELPEDAEEHLLRVLRVPSRVLAEAPQHKNPLERSTARTGLPWIGRSGVRHYERWSRLM